MYRKPVNTGQKPTSQPSLCSILSKKLYQRTQKGHEQGKEGSRLIPEHDKPKRDDGAKKNKERKEVADKCEIKTVLKMLKRTTPFLPKALLSPYAYEKGKKGCEMCNMDKESYKPFLKSGKVIQLIADDIISKEQKEMLDCDDKQNEIQDTKKIYEKNNTKEEKKISIQFEVYCQKQIDHNLKCVLLKLQKTIGDVIVQVCYCKTKKIPGDERCKTYAVSTTVLEQLKFEYTNLTSKIIQLFKNPPSNLKASPEICVACMKEDLTDCTTKLEKILKNGRNLKVTMRNEDTHDGKCCSRTYPHVHAIVQGKHVVLKFELPFEVTQPRQKCDGKPKDQAYEEFPRTVTPPPYDEWPKDFNPEPTKDGNQIKSQNEFLPSEKETPTSKPNSLPEEKAPEKSSSVSDKSVKPLKIQESIDSHLSDKPPLTRHKSIYKSVSSGSYVSSESPQSQKLSSTKPSDTPDMMPKQTSYKPKSKDSDNPDYKAKDSDDPDSKAKDSDNPDYKAKDSDDPDSKAKDSDNPDSEKQNVDQYTGKNNNSQKPESDNKLERSSDSFLDYDDYSSSDSVSMDKKQQNKQVSFIPEQKKTIYYVKDTPPQSGFRKVHDNDEQHTELFESKSSNIVKLKETSLEPIDSVILMKNKYSLSEKSKPIKELEHNKSSEKPVFSVPQYEIKQALHTEPTIADLQGKSSRTLNKQQVREVIKDLGATKLLSVNFPAGCCKNKRSENDFKCASDLPFSASLHSLPLDQDDLNHITRAVEKLISTEDIVLVPDCDEEWEIQYTEDSDDKEDQPKWHKAFTARDTSSNIRIEIQTDKPVIRKKIEKSLSQRDVISLPTIDEERISPDEKSIKLSLLDNGEESKDIRNKNRSATSFRTTELRYLTVEYPLITNKIKISDHNQRCRVAKSKSHPCLRRCYHKHQDGSRSFNRNTNKLKSVICTKRVDHRHKSEDSFNVSSSMLKTLSTESMQLTKPSKSCNKNHNLSPVDELIMLNVIYLPSNNNSNKFITALDSANNISKYYGDNMKLFKPWGSNVKLSKLISSHDFFNQNISFDIEATSSTSSSKMQVVERREGLTKQTEQKFQDSLNTSLINQITEFKGDNGFNTVIVNDCNNTMVESQHFRDISSSADNCNATDNISQTCIENGETEFLRVKMATSNNKIVKNVKSEVGLLKSTSCCKVPAKFTKHSESSNVLLSADKKEEKIAKSPKNNRNSITVKNKLNLNHHNLSHRNYFIFKKYKNVTAKCDKPTYKKLKRKPSILKNTQISFKSVKCKISKPVIKFAKITKVTSHYEVPHLMLSPENHDSNVIGNFGLQKNYKCVNNCHKSESEPNPSNLTSSLKNHVEQINESHRNKNVYTDLEKLASLSSGVSFITADPSATNEKHIYSSDHIGIPFYLFDVNGQPLTDTSGRPLHNSNGEMLVQLDRAELPLCDLNNCPIFDSSGHAVDENDFNPFEPPFSDILKVLTPLGDPMVLYDFEGRPLTSASGTMLMDSKGRGLLRFNCKGNPVTDFRGKPIFNSKGKEVVETK